MNAEYLMSLLLSGLIAGGLSLMYLFFGGRITSDLLSGVLDLGTTSSINMTTSSLCLPSLSFRYTSMLCVFLSGTGSSVFLLSLVDLLVAVSLRSGTFYPCFFCSALYNIGACPCS